MVITPEIPLKDLASSNAGARVLEDNRFDYRALEALERGLMRHIHLEKNVLFPPARALAADAG